MDIFFLQLPIARHLLTQWSHMDYF